MRQIDQETLQKTNHAPGQRGYSPGCKFTYQSQGCQQELLWHSANFLCYPSVLGLSYFPQTQRDVRLSVTLIFEVKQAVAELRGKSEYELGTLELFSEVPERALRPTP